MGVFDYLKATSRRVVTLSFTVVFAVLGAIQYVTGAAIALEWWGWALLALVTFSVAQFLVWRDVTGQTPDPIDQDAERERRKHRRKLLTDGADLLHDHQQVGGGLSLATESAPFLKDKRYVHLRPFLKEVTVQSFERGPSLGQSPTIIVTDGATGIEGSQHLRALAQELQRLHDEWNL